MTTMTMTFGNNTLQYGIALDTAKQVFMAYDPENPSKIGYGITIEQAIAELKKNS
ncbi:hypothetical protein [Vagococcus salmoninarum]|uniref:hypothetical protein n=1 Tax=Vagococcus salmoninarum TaxID=2739 RepID=UPI0028D1182E|nr:hypothetical protein [Vagococcus salmoninarum]